jgi:glycosyltransferase involved in cell wall biosynthesis
VVLDMDDLLSKRYAAWADAGVATERVLGYYGDMLPQWLRPFLSRLASRCLRWESRRIGTRELFWGARCDEVSLVSRNEGDRLTARIGKSVRWLPMSIPRQDARRASPSRAVSSLVFLGGLDYQANLDAVRFFTREIAPALNSSGLANLRLHVIGYCSDKVRSELSSPNIVLHGYVPDVSAEIRKHQIFVAPIRFGTGIKTKVVEAMAHALPVVSTAKGVEGLDVVHGEHCLIADSPRQIADAISLLCADRPLREQLARRSAEHLAASFSLEVIAQRWSETLSNAISSGVCASPGVRNGRLTPVSR